MGLGVLEPAVRGPVPGTAILDDAALAQPQAAQMTHRVLKYGSGKDSNLILSPQPSDDPNDPLNWSFGRRFGILLIIIFGAVVNVSCSLGLIGASVVPLSVTFKRPTVDITRAIGYQNLAAGVSGLILSPFARKYGKRPVYVGASFISIIALIIVEFANTYPVLVGSRVLQGVGAVTYESLIFSSVGDLFFIHERGAMMALSTFVFVAMNNFATLLSGVISARLGWAYTIHILIPFTVIQFFLALFFVPESLFRRELAVGGGSVPAPSEATSDKQTDAEQIENLKDGDSAVAESSIPPKKTLWQQMALYNGTFTEDSVLRMAVAPFLILTNIGVLYSIVLGGTMQGWFVAASLLSSVTFSAPPYRFTPEGVGLTYTGSIVGSILALITLALVQRRAVQWFVRRNNGVYEPEFCLWLVLPGMCLIITGITLLGYTAHMGKSIILVCFFWGMMIYGIAFVASVTGQYGLDAFRANSTEIFVMSMTYKNFLFYALSNFLIPWVSRVNIFGVTYVLAIVSAVLCSLTLPMYILGKKYRLFWHNHNVLRMAGLGSEKPPVGR